FVFLVRSRPWIYTLSLHDALPISVYLTVADELGMLLWCEMPSWSDCWYPSDHFSLKAAERGHRMFEEMLARDWNHPCIVIQTVIDRKSTRLNSSHGSISYAVFCLK